MSEFEIRVVGARPPKKPGGPRRGFFGKIGTIVRAVLMRPRATLLAGLVGFVAFAGTPHVPWEYACRHPMRGPGTCQVVSWCAYYGIQGRRVAVPSYGRQCSLVKVLPLDWSKISGNL